MKPLRILIVSTYFPPAPSIASLRTYSFAKYWARMGNDVTVLTTKKEDFGEVALNLPVENFTVLEIPFFNVFAVAKRLLKALTGVGRGAGNGGGGRASETGSSAPGERAFIKLKNRLKRFAENCGIFITDRIPDVNDFWIGRAIAVGERLIKEKGCDWIFSSYAPPASHIVAGKLAVNKNCRWVADYRDLWIENHVWVGKWPFTVLEKVLEKKYVGRRADLVTTVSEPLAVVLRRKFSAPVHVIENGYDEDDYRGDFPPWFTGEKKRIVYTGTVYPGKQDPSPLFAVLSDLAGTSGEIRRKMDEKLEVLFFGSESEWLSGLIREQGVQRWVRHGGMVSRDEALRIQKQADLLLFLEWDNGSVDGILTGKLFEYLAMRKPILGVGVSSRTTPGALMEETGVGLAVGNDREKIRRVLLNLLDGGIPFPVNPKDDVIRRYTRRRQAERLLEIMERCGSV